MVASPLLHATGPLPTTRTHEPVMSDHVVEMVKSVRG